MPYRQDRKWSDQFIPEIIRLFEEDTRIVGAIGEHKIKIASDEIDMKKAGDLVFQNEDKKIAARVREFSFHEKFSKEFTIRAARDSGAETELFKIMEKGFGDLMFYAFAHPLYEGKFRQWVIIDLEKFRFHMTGTDILGPDNLIPNKDGTYFKAFKLADLPLGTIIARSD